MEAFNIAAASEDHNVYIFDVRKFDKALNVLKDHVAAVMEYVLFNPAAVGHSVSSHTNTDSVLNSLLPVKNLSLLRMTRLSDCGTETRATLGTFTTPSECREYSAPTLVSYFTCCILSRQY